MVKVTPKLVDMAYDDEESYEAVQPISMPDKPDYPYELRICLTDKTLKKLGLDAGEVAEGLGGTITGHFEARITSANLDKYDGPDGPRETARIELQIEKLGLDSEEAEENETPVAKRRSLIYENSTT